MPGVAATSSGLTPADADVLAPFVRVWGTYLRDARQLLPLAEKHGAILARDHGSIRRNPNRMRFENGFWFYKTGFHATRWWYNVERNDPDPYTTFDIPGNWESNLVYSTFEGPPNPTLDWEAAREGVDDCKYVYTLASRIEKWKNAKRPMVRRAVANGRAALAEALDPIEIDERYYRSVGDNYSPDAYDKYRWKIAHAILGIDAAVSDGAVDQPSKKVEPRWWDAASEDRVRIEVNAGPYEREDAIVSAGLPEGLANIRLVEVRNGKATAIPFVLRDGGKTIFWRLPGHTPSLAARWFYAHGTRDPQSPAKSDPALEEAVARYIGGKNLILNGDFEKAEPVGWTLHPKDGSPVTLTKGEAHSGKQCLRCDVTARRNGATTDDIPLRPHREYLLTCWTRLVRGSAGLIMWASVRCYSEDGTYLERFQSTRRDLKPGWQLSAVRFTAPPETHHAKLGVSPAQLKGSILFDDIRLCEYSRDRFLPPKVIVGERERKQKTVISPFVVRE